jgi:hypothetical protein
VNPKSPVEGLENVDVGKTLEATWFRRRRHSGGGDRARLPALAQPRRRRHPSKGIGYVIVSLLRLVKREPLSTNPMTQ